MRRAPGGKLPGVFLSTLAAETPMSRKASRRSFALRHYLWLDGQAYRIPRQLHSLLLDGEARLPQFAGTTQRIIEAVILREGVHAPRIELRCGTYVFDPKGRVDLSDQLEAISGLVGAQRSGNVVD